jgi:hypothetical protein
MILQARRVPGNCSTILLTGIALAFAGANCGSSGSSTSPLPDASLAKDTAAPTPDTAPLAPDASLAKDTAAPTPDTAPLAPDAGLAKDTATGTPDVKPLSPDVNSVPDTAAGTPDVTMASPDVLAQDAPTDAFAGQTTDGGVAADVGPDGPASATEVGADQKGGETGASCQNPTSAVAYQVSALTNLAWDKDGSLVTAQSFYSNRVLGGKSLTNAGSADLFVAKLSPSDGNASWVITAGDSNDQYVSGVATSSTGIGAIGTSTGNIALATGACTGSGSASLCFKNNTGTPVDYILGADSTAGTGTWVKAVNLQGGTLKAIAGNINKDYFVVCGAAMNTAANLSTAGLTGITGTPGGGKDVVVAAVKASDGTVLWAKLFGGTLDQSCSAAALDDDGNAVFAGTYAGTLDFGSGALSPAPTGSGDQILWMAKLKGTDGSTMVANAYGTTGYVTPTAIGTDSLGGVVVGGYFQSTVIFGSTALAPVGTSDAFVAKFNASLAPSWARRWGAAVASSKGVAVDSQGNPTVVGNFTKSIDVGPGTQVLTAHTELALDAFVVNLDGADGTTLCAQNYGDATSNATGANAIAINRWASGAMKDSVAIVGTFNKLVTFGPTVLSSAGTQSYLVEM